MDIRAIVKQRCERLGLSGNELARRSGLPQPTIQRYLQGHRDLTGARLGRVLGALGLQIRPAPKKSQNPAQTP